MRMGTKTWQARFWLHVKRREPEHCWVWTGACTSKGYGVFDTPAGRRSHRLSWLIHFGPIPTGLLVCHRCDNPACVNPDHLFVGTNADNMRDRNIKGRTASGERNGRAKLTSQEVQQIREGASEGLTRTELGRRFGVHRSTITLLVNNLNWTLYTGARK